MGMMIEDVQAEYAKLAAQAHHTPRVHTHTDIVGDWKGEVEENVFYPYKGQLGKDDPPKRIRVVHHAIILTKQGRDELRFSVSHTFNKKTEFRSTTICDRRQDGTGVLGVTGQWGTGTSLSIPNRAKSLTPTSWIDEVSPRYISRARANELLVEAGYDGTIREM